VTGGASVTGTPTSVQVDTDSGLISAQADVSGSQTTIDLNLTVGPVVGGADVTGNPTSITLDTDVGPEGDAIGCMTLQIVSATCTIEMSPPETVNVDLETEATITLVSATASGYMRGSSATIVVTERCLV
jgi:hypothetical protein